MPDDSIESFLPALDELVEAMKLDGTDLDNPRVVEMVEEFTVAYWQDLAERGELDDVLGSLRRLENSLGLVTEQDIRRRAALAVCREHARRQRAETAQNN